MASSATAHIQHYQAPVAMTPSSSSSSYSYSYSLNSPTSSTTTLPPASSSSSLSSSSQSSLSQPTPRKRQIRASAPPPPRRPRTNSATLAPPPLPHHTNFDSLPNASPTVLSSPDPAHAVRTARRSVQFSKQPGANVNWARPLAPNHEHAPAVPPLPPSSFSMRPSTSSGGDSSRRTSGSTSISSSSCEDELPMTPGLPPGAGTPEVRPWAVPSGLKGLGMSGVSVPAINTAPGPMHPELFARGSEDSLASEAGSLGGESTQTASSSSPTTPTRLLFVSESLDALSKPSTLDELTRLRAAAKQLDFESQRLRRLKGKDPASIKNLPRKAVPTITDAELRARPKPRRPAVRHSLLTPSPRDGGYSFMVDPPLPVSDASNLPRDHPFSNPAIVAKPTTLAEARSNAAAKAAKANAAMSAFDNLVISPPQPASARRHAFYSQGKAAQSVIEFSPRKDTGSPPGSTSGWTPPPFLRARHASNTAPSLGDVAPSSSSKPRCSAKPRVATTPASPTVPGPPVMALPAPVPVMPAQTASLPMPSVPHTPMAQPERKASHSFLNKHKKISRLFGKAAA